MLELWRRVSRLGRSPPVRIVKNGITRDKLGINRRTMGLLSLLVPETLKRNSALEGLTASPLRTTRCSVGRVFHGRDGTAILCRIYVEGPYPV